jgi:hypothetical protein
MLPMLFNDVFKIGKKMTKANMTQLIKRILFLVLIMQLAIACEFISNGSSPSIPKDNPGANANLPEAFAQQPSDNAFRMTTAERIKQICDGEFCTQLLFSYIDYVYDPSTGRLDSTTESEVGVITNTVVSNRQYYYVDNRLDKVAVGEGGNFLTLHDYTYDDENDDSDGYQAIGLDRPKLRKEYVCSINTSDALSENCDRNSADSITSYIYYADGYLYRKELDVNGNKEIDHQKIYYYDNSNNLVRIDTDNFYNGNIDERYEYTGVGKDLIVFIDKDYLSSLTRGAEEIISYKLANNDSYVVKECYFRGTMEQTCSDDSRESFNWVFTWEEDNCWAGGLDDINPDTYSIGYLCTKAKN